MVDRIPDRGDELHYLSYLLRLWRVADGQEPVWRASLQDARTRELLGFAGLEELFQHLRAETGTEDEGCADAGSR